MARPTLALLEAAAAIPSTTSAFGSSLNRTGSAPAIWVTEELASGPRNIYGATKIMAENLCELAHKQHRLPVVVLRTSRFFPEYIISATTPFTADDLQLLGHDAEKAVRLISPESERLYAARNWRFFPQIDRVYVNNRARTELGWTPKYDFAYAMKCLSSGQDFRSSLPRDIGSKGYHDQSFAEGPYPVA